MDVFRCWKIDAKMQAAILLSHQHDSVAPSTLTRPDGTRFQHFPQMVPDFLHHRWWNSSELLLEKGCHQLPYGMLVEWVQPSSARSNENTSWYSARRWHASSTNSGAHNSNHLSLTHQTAYCTFCLIISWRVWWSEFASSSTSKPSGLGVQVLAVQILPLPWVSSS